MYLYNGKKDVDTNAICNFMFRQLACTRCLACSWMVSFQLGERSPFFLVWNFIVDNTQLGVKKVPYSCLNHVHIYIYIAYWWISCTFTPWKINISPEKGPFQKLSSNHPFLGAIGQYFSGGDVILVFRTFIIRPVLKQKLTVFVRVTNYISYFLLTHPCRLTWNIIMEVGKMIFPF